MANGQKIVVVMQAYNAEKILDRPYGKLPQAIVEKVLLVEGGRADQNVEVAKLRLIENVVYPKYQRSGTNQNNRYATVLKESTNIVAMVHPYYPYTSIRITAVADMVASGHLDMALESRILGGRTLEGGMSLYKYLSNQMLDRAIRFEYRVDGISCPARLPLR